MTLPMTIRIVSSKVCVCEEGGIVMEATSSYFLPKLIRLSRVMRLITTESVYLATSLFESLFSEVVEPEKALPKALELADEVARNTSAISTYLMKDMM